VVVGFSALLLTPLVETRSVGLGGLIVVGVAVLICLTLLPALLAALGRSIDRPRWLARRLAWYHAPGVWERWARSLARHPRRALVIGGTLAAVLTAPALWIRIGLPARHWWPEQSEAGAGLRTLDRMGVSGYITPIRVVIEAPPGELAIGAAQLRGLRALSDTMRADPRVLDVRSIVDLESNRSILSYSLLYAEIDSARARHGDFLNAYLSRDARTTLMDIVPRDTVSLTTAMELVHRVRDVARGGTIRRLEGAEIRVGGYVAASVDSQEQLLGQFPTIIALVHLATAVMLAIAYRSVLVPL
jgi:RND superfamily putative drug exporter